MGMPLSAVDRVRGKAGRDAFQDALVDLGRTHAEVVIVGADTFRSIRGEAFEKAYPDRSFNLGIAEQNAVGVAAGLAIGGKVPIVLLFGFTIARALEQVKSSICYPNLNVKLVSNSTGLDMGEGGVTHHCTEDIALLRVLANMTIVQPGSALEVVYATNALVEQIKGPAYLRHTRQRYPEEAEQALEQFYLGGGVFEVGRAILLRDGADVTLVGSGLTVGLALQTAAALAADGVQARVINLHTIKPLDAEAIVRAARETKAIVTIEDHNVLGGLGEGVSAVVTTHHPTRVLHVGIQDTFCEVGSPKALCAQHGLCPERIAEQTKSLLSRREQQT